MVKTNHAPPPPPRPRLPSEPLPTIDETYTRLVVAMSPHDRLEAVAALIAAAQREASRLREALATPAPSTPPKFPVAIRKMWSGGEVQDWIDRNWTNMK